MLTFVGDGIRINYSNSGAAIASGDVVVLRSGTAGRIGIAVADIGATTGTGVLEVGPGRVHQLPKKTGDAFTNGALAYWDTANTYITTSTANTTLAGSAIEAAASAGTTVKVAINT